MWVRGLKLNRWMEANGRIKSHPMWVRGLKQQEKETEFYDDSRTLCGCVD